MTREEKRVKLAEECGYRRWKFGDPWCKGLKLADGRFNGYVRHVIKDAEPDSKTVLLDIDEAWTNPVSEIVKHYTPVSHWVKDGVVKAFLPNYFVDLNAIQEEVLKLDKVQQNRFINLLDQTALENSDDDPVDRDFRWCCASAEERAEALGIVLNLWQYGQH